MSSSYKYASIIPLIGGETIAMEKAFGKRPEYIMSYSGFEANDSQLLNYYNNEVPYHVLDKNDAPKESVDVVNSVCPCAGLSMLNTSASAEQPANDWMIESADYVLKNVQPKVFWGENAPGLYGNMGKPVVKRLREVGDKYGYTMTLYKTKSTLHGLGQTRNRSFYFFWKDERTPLIPYFKKEQEPIEECIRNAFVSKDDPMNELTNEKKPSDNPWYQYALEITGKTHKEFYEELESSTNIINWVEKQHGLEGYKIIGKWFKENGFEKPAATAERMYNKLKAGGNVMKRCVEFGKGHTSAFVGHFATELVHPDEDRYLTIREALSIMKMPKDFQLQGGRKNLNMICQNVPVTTAQDMAASVKKYLDGNLDSISSRFVKQSNLTQTREEEYEPNTLDEFLYLQTS